MNKKYLEDNAQIIGKTNVKDQLYNVYAGEKTYYYLDGEIWSYVKYDNKLSYMGKNGCEDYPVNFESEIISETDKAESVMFYDRSYLDMLLIFKSEVLQ